MCRSIVRCAYSSFVMLSWECELKRVGQLDDLLQGLKRTFAHFDGLLQSRCQNGPDEADIAISRTCIEVFNAWALFGRCFYISSMLGVQSRKGNFVRPAGRIPTIREAILTATKAVCPRFAGTPTWFDEPKWYNHEDMLKVWTRATLSNLPSLQAAYGLPLNAVHALRATRNFYAHRNEDTMYKYSRTLISQGYAGIDHPSAFLLKRTASRQRTILQDWMLDISIIAEEMCN